MSEGTNIIPRCISNTSAANVVWTRADGRALTPATQNGQDLLLVNATSAFNGIFVCNVSNTAGFNTAFINVTVVCKFS